MLTTLRTRFGVPGVIAGIALFVAMGGAAFAAQKYVITSTKQIKPSVLKALQGKAGPVGPAGSTGSSGSPGQNGAPGKDGTNGKDGTFSTESLPPGQTLTGSWGGAPGTGGGLATASISFPIEVTPAPTAVVQLGPGEKISILVKDGAFELNPSNSADLTELEEAWEDDCPGTANEPEAKAGFLCMYAVKNGGAVVTLAPSGELEAANEFGITVPFILNTESVAKGSWAVTG